jgi:hypothetical protein
MNATDVENKYSRDSIAVVVTVVDHEDEYHKARRSRELTQLKIKYGMEVMSRTRLPEAKRLSSGMRVVFYQGGPQSGTTTEIRGVGCLVAVGYFGELELESVDGPSLRGKTPQDLWIATERYFPRKREYPLIARCTYSDVKEAPGSLYRLMKAVIGRTPMPGDNYLVFEPGDASYDALLNWWTKVWECPAIPPEPR